MKKLCIILLLSIFTVSICADDVTDSIKEGLDYYNQGDYANAMQSLDYASQLIKQKKGTMLEDYLPKPLSGWDADAATSTAASQALLGGGINAEREYHKNNRYLHASIMSDSPIMSSVMMMLTNPMIATSDGGKMEKINGQKALIKYDEESRSGEIQIVVANKYLVQFNGSDLDRDDLINYAKAIDYQKLAQLQ